MPSESVFFADSRKGWGVFDDEGLNADEQIGHDAADMERALLVAGEWVVPEHLIERVMRAIEEIRIVERKGVARPWLSERGGPTAIRLVP